MLSMAVPAVPAWGPGPPAGGVGRASGGRWARTPRARRAPGTARSAAWAPRGAGADPAAARGPSRVRAGARTRARPQPAAGTRRSYPVEKQSGVQGGVRHAGGEGARGRTPTLSGRIGRECRPPAARSVCRLSVSTITEPEQREGASCQSCQIRAAKIDHLMLARCSLPLGASWLGTMRTLDGRRGFESRRRH